MKNFSTEDNIGSFFNDLTRASYGISKDGPAPTSSGNFGPNFKRSLRRPSSFKNKMFKFLIASMTASWSLNLARRMSTLKISLTEILCPLQHQRSLFNLGKIGKTKRLRP